MSVYLNGNAVHDWIDLHVTDQCATIDVTTAPAGEVIIPERNLCRAQAGFGLYMPILTGEGVDAKAQFCQHVVVVVGGLGQYRLKPFCGMAVTNLNAGASAKLQPDWIFQKTKGEAYAI